MYTIVVFLLLPCLINTSDGVNLKKIRKPQPPKLPAKFLTPNRNVGVILSEFAGQRHQIKPLLDFRYIFSYFFKRPRVHHMHPPEDGLSMNHKHPPSIVSSYSSIIDRVKTIPPGAIIDLITVITYKLYLIGNNVNLKDKNVIFSSKPGKVSVFPNVIDHSNGNENHLLHGPPGQIMQNLKTHHGIDLTKLSPKELHDLLHYLKELNKHMEKGPPTFKPNVNQLCCPIG